MAKSCITKAFRQQKSVHLKKPEPLHRAEDINGYGFESRHFTAVIYKSSSQFKEVIAPGRVRLLRSMKLYDLAKDTAFAPLETEKKYAFRNGQRYESEDKVWLSRVKPMLNDCPTTAQALDNIQLSDLTPRQIELKFSKLIALSRGEDEVLFRSESQTVCFVRRTGRSVINNG